jgi:hypothetical protein
MSGKKLLSNGKRVSKPSGPHSKTKNVDRNRRLEKLLAAAYESFNSKKNSASQHDFVFHMTDWIDDLDALSELYDHPERFDKAQAASIVAGFLYHALWHVRAAARLLLQFEPEDIFKDVDGVPLASRNKRTGTRSTSSNAP